MSTEGVDVTTIAEDRVSVREGDLVSVVDACGRPFRKRALTGVVPGHNFPVVWLCSEEEWETARNKGRKADGRPWPVEDIDRDDLESVSSAVAREVGR